MRRVEPKSVVVPLIALVAALGGWAGSLYYWVSVRGPTDALHFRPKLEVMNGRICAGSEAAIMGVGDGPDGSHTFYLTQTRWTIDAWRNYNRNAYQENWGPSRSGFRWRVVVPLWAPVIPAGIWVLWRLVLRRRASRGGWTCAGCGYDLSGQVGEGCPECGLGLETPPVPHA